MIFQDAENWVMEEGMWKRKYVTKGKGRAEQITRFTKKKNAEFPYACSSSQTNLFNLILWRCSTGLDWTTDHRKSSANPWRPLSYSVLLMNIWRIYVQSLFKILCINSKYLIAKATAPFKPNKWFWILQNWIVNPENLVPHIQVAVF